MGVYEMKNKLILCAVIVGVAAVISVSLLFFNSYNYSDWHEIEIEDVGTIKIPNEWHTETSDNGIVIMDSSGNTYLLGFYVSKEFRYETDVYNFKDIISSEMLSNSARFGNCSVEINGECFEKLFLKVYGSGEHDSMQFFAVDESVDSDLIKQMAESYKMYYTASR